MNSWRFEGENESAAKDLRLIVDIDWVRVREITMALYKENPSDYTSIIYRYRGLIAASKQCSDEDMVYRELEVSAMMISLCEKSYLGWDYRWMILNILKNHDPDYVPNELLQLNLILCICDSKNHHYWAYRSKVVDLALGHTSNRDLLLDTEIAFINKAIGKDLFNNSAWSYKVGIFEHCSMETDSSYSRALKGLDHCWSIITQAPFNSSAWSFLSYLHKEISKNYIEISENPTKISDTSKKHKIDELVPTELIKDILASIEKDTDWERNDYITDTLKQINFL